MSAIVAGGVLVVFGSACLNGSFTLPMKFVLRRRSRLDWKWHQVWLLYSLSGCLVLPWVIAMASINPYVLFHAYAEAGALRCVGCALLAGGWGLGNVCLAAAQALVGSVIAFALVLGVSGAIGSIGVMAVFESHKVFHTSGVVTMCGVVALVVGLVMVTAAGWWRDVRIRQEMLLASQSAKIVTLPLEEESSTQDEESSYTTSSSFDQESDDPSVLSDKGRPEAYENKYLSEGYSTFHRAKLRDLIKHGSQLPRKISKRSQSSVWRFSIALALCLLGGCLYPLLNVALAYGRPIARHLHHHGVSELLSPLGVWAIAIGTLGALCNAAVPAAHMSVARTWTSMATAPISKSRKKVTISSAAELCLGWILPTMVMGPLWYISIAIYAIASSPAFIGDPAIAWPLFMSGVITMASVWGVVLGEWKGAKLREWTFLGIGLFSLLSSAATIGYASAL